MLLLLKETWKEDRFFMEGNYNRNVDALLAFKKSCGNTIKFASQNIPHALIQVSWIFKNELNIGTVHRDVIWYHVPAGSYHSSLLFWDDNANGAQL